MLSLMVTVMPPSLADANELMALISLPNAVMSNSPKGVGGTETVSVEKKSPGLTESSTMPVIISLNPSFVSLSVPMPG